MQVLVLHLFSPPGKIEVQISNADCRSKDHLSFYSERNVHRHIDDIQTTDTFKSVSSAIKTQIITLIKQFHRQ